MSDPRRLRTPGRFPARQLGLAVLAAAAGCGQDGTIRPGDIRSYSAPRPAPALVPSTASAPGPAAAGIGPLRYDLPAGWNAASGSSGIRLATVTIGPPADGLEVTVTPASGSLRANVERWQGQLAGDADAAANSSAVERALAEAATVEVAGTEATIVLLFDPEAGAGGAGEAILGGMVPVDGASALFVKFKGAAEIARRERDNFTRFVSSLRWN